MDYRSTEAFARDIEAAALRAQGLRQEAITAFWQALGAGIRAAWAALLRRLVRAPRTDTLFPEA
ncbi:hypothetical protein [Ramlibacter sp. AN1133]|uniref:hypothetical protein n=1 Tax=Ramlibacter sp. AN1133 TaxID=3133429 RepID=UPI0030BEEEE2